MNIKYSFIYHMNKKRRIACCSHLLMTYSSKKIPWNFHTSLRSHLKNSCFGFHQAFQTPRNNKSTRPKRPRAFICFSVFGTPDETLALVFDILLQRVLNNLILKQALQCRFTKDLLMKWMLITVFPYHLANLKVQLPKLQCGHISGCPPVRVDCLSVEWMQQCFHLV